MSFFTSGGGQPGQQQDARNVFMQSMSGLATTVAVIAAFLGAPLLYEFTHPWVERLAYRTYGSDMADLVTVLWFLLCFPLIFFASRASIAVSIMSAAGAAAAHLFPLPF